MRLTSIRKIDMKFTEYRSESVIFGQCSKSRSRVQNQLKVESRKPENIDFEKTDEWNQINW